MSKRPLLKARADKLEAIRTFFKARDVIEVDTFCLASGVIVDEHIDLMRVTHDKTPLYLLSSPEGPMKQLLAQGSGDIYQLGHVYRQGEQGTKHSPVFTMLEWYQVGANFNSFINTNCELLSLFTGPHPITFTSYNEAFVKYADCNDLLQETLYSALKLAGISFEGEQETLEHLVWGALVEPKLGKAHFEVITDYPESQAALSQIKNQRAQRFEIYFQGMELANGYVELQEGAAYKKRLDEQNAKRAKQGKPTYQVDTQLIQTLTDTPLPDCLGIAIGFDRLLMLHLNCQHLHEVLPLPLY